MRDQCDACGNRALIKHCDSPTCTWAKCNDKKCNGYGDDSRWTTPNGSAA